MKKIEKLIEIISEDAVIVQHKKSIIIKSNTLPLTLILTCSDTNDIILEVLTNGVDKTFLTMSKIEEIKDTIKKLYEKLDKQNTVIEDWDFYQRNYEMIHDYLKGKGHPDNLLIKGKLISKINNNLSDCDDYDGYNIENPSDSIVLEDKITTLNSILEVIEKSGKPCPLESLNLNYHTCILNNGKFHTCSIPISVPFVCSQEYPILKSFFPQIPQNEENEDRFLKIISEKNTEIGKIVTLINLGYDLNDNTHRTPRLKI